MTAREVIGAMYDDLTELSFLLRYKFYIDRNKETGEMIFLAGESGITPDEFDNIISCYFIFNYAMKEVNEV